MSMPNSAGSSFANPEFIAGRPDDVTLVDAPINPEWIVEGNPRARAGLHSPSIDGNASTHIWECTAGTFWWTFHDEETVFILEGQVRVTTPSGQTRTLQPGDIAYFAEGTKALWDIDDYVKKVAFCRKSSNPIKQLRAMLGRMRRVVVGEVVSVRVLGTIGVALPL
ncbi:DUF861 domain-containing protein [Rhizobium sp. TH2]|uniref:cupin domain-containing protein n=1 Tax=Rhizobium sp. TH2 TaxID=2775403 RepID=UPI0021588879|nr:cupin domain-containing protein [Rhizobium sp. TH2]UVC10054.1 DUF861 domain-containing protein [Rhizobium sp. TH2]